MAGRAATFFFFYIFLNLVTKYSQFKKKEVPSRTFLTHPAATQETEFFLVWREIHPTYPYAKIWDQKAMLKGKTLGISRFFVNF